MRKRIGKLVVLAGFLATTCFATPSHPHKITTNKSSRILDLSDLISSNELTFAVKNYKTGTISYTHFPLFIKHSDNYFYQDDNRLQGFSMPDANTLTSDSCTLTDVKAPDDVQLAQATSLMKISLILNATDISPPHEFNETDSTSYNYTIANRIFDQSGNIHHIHLYYIKTETPNLWNVKVMLHHALIASGTIQFTQSGELETTTGLNQITFTPKEGQSPQTVTLELDAVQFAGTEDSLRSGESNGHIRGDAMEERVDKNGYISELYSNTQIVTFNKIAIYKDK